MSHCKWWNKEQDKCIHPNAPQNGDCDWYDEYCPYDEQITDKGEQVVESTEIDVYAKCPKCHCDLEYHDMLSTDYDDMYYFVNWSAFCPQCQRTFTIAEDFKLTERRIHNAEDDN